MNDLMVLNIIEELTQVRTKAQLESWVDNCLMLNCPASSLLIGYGKMQSEFAMIPYYVSPSFPKSLIKTFDINDPHLAVPMLEEWRNAGTPVIGDLSGDGRHDSLWQTMFRQKGFSKVAVAVNMDRRNGYTTYLCMTDPYVNQKMLEASKFQKHFAIIAPILHNVLSQLEYQAALAKKDDKIGKLTPRENEILQWIKEGKTNFEISCILGISFSTIKNHVQKILIKLQVNNRTQAISKYS